MGTWSLAKTNSRYAHPNSRIRPPTLCQPYGEIADGDGPHNPNIDRQDTDTTRRGVVYSWFNFMKDFHEKNPTSGKAIQVTSIIS